MNNLHVYFLLAMLAFFLQQLETRFSPQAANRLTYSCLPSPVVNKAPPISRYELIITEIMADPSPSAGLPEFEYVELKNNSRRTIDLKGCKLGDESSFATIAASLLLKPDSFLVLCSNTAATALRAFGTTAGLSNFPSLGNETDLVQLLAPEGHVLHAIEYQSSWHSNAVKATGGWSYEMINTSTPCAGGNNWTSSTAAIGGTPGHRNSVKATQPDLLPPALLHTYSPDSSQLVAVFDEPIDSNSAAQPKNFRLSPLADHPLSSLSMPPLFNTVWIRFKSPMKKATVYQLLVNNLQDCQGNTIGTLNQAKAGIPDTAALHDIVINELLFDPPPEGSDYVELYNRSEKIVPLQRLLFSNRNNANELSNSKALTSKPLQLFPGEYILLSEHPGWVGNNFPVKDRSRLFSSTLPSLPNDRGSLVLTDAGGAVIDELHYESGWHYSLLTATEGISLERIDPDITTSIKSNWTSAAGSSPAGTPGYVNAQFRSMHSQQGRFNLSASVFSPDRDGVDDLLFLEYKMDVAGSVASVTVFDLAGKPVKQLINNALLAYSGYFRWDGLSDALQPCAEGIYIVQLRWFNITGRTGRWKQAVGLVRRKQ